MRVTALLHDPQACYNLRYALRPAPGFSWHGDLRFAASWRELEDWANQDSFDLVFVDPCFGSPSASPRANVPGLERLASSCGGEAVALYLCPGGHAGALLLVARPLAFPFLLTLGVDDTSRFILRLVARSRVRRHLAAHLERTGALAPGPSQGWLLETVTGWPPVRWVGELAGQHKLPLRVLRREVAGAGLPSPRRLLAWARLLEAWVLWELGMESRELLALTLGFGGSDALAHFARNLTGQPLGEFLARAGGLDPLQRLLAEVSRAG